MRTEGDAGLAFASLSIRSSVDAADMEMLQRILRKRRWWQFSLRSLLIACALIAIACGTFVGRIRTQRQAVGEIRQLGGQVTYEANWLGRVLPESIQKRLGEDACGNVVSVELQYRTIDRRMVTLKGGELDKAVDVISRLPHVSRLSLHTLDLSDDDLGRLAPLRNRIEELYINELFHFKLKGSKLECFAGWTQLRSLEVLSEVNESLNLEPLASLPNLARLGIGGGTLNEKAFKDIAKLKSLQTLYLFQCGFDGECLRHLQKSPNLGTLTLHNICPATWYESYTMDEFGKYRPKGKPSFRFERGPRYGRWTGGLDAAEASSDGLGQPEPFPLERYRAWLKEILPNVQIHEFQSS